jgi:hypothetical protein
MNENEPFVGNDNAPGDQSVDASLENGNDVQKVNPGSIRKSQTQSILNALSNAAGVQFDSVEAAASWAARIGASQTLGGNAQPVERSVQQSKPRNAGNDLQEQFSKLQQDLQVKEQRLREKDLDGDIQRYMDRFDPDLLDYALNKVKSNIQWNEDGAYSIVNSKGQERYGSDGNPLTLQGLVGEVAKGNPKLLKQSQQNSGSGLRPGQGSFAGEVGEAIPDYTRDPAAFNAWAARNGLGKNVGLKGMGVSASVSSGSKKLF